MGNSKKKPTKGNRVYNDDRHCKKSWKKRKGVSPAAHNGHSVGGYSIDKYGAERAAELAELHTRPRPERRVARRELNRQHQLDLARPVRKTRTAA